VALTDADGSTVARGTPVCRGRYRGVARVVTRLADAATIKQVTGDFDVLNQQDLNSFVQ
jgi:uncharacterized protein (DUF433 family)